MKPVQTAIVGVCVYEIAAIATGKVPTVSSICRKYRVVEVGFLAWLVCHLHKKTEVVVVAEVRAVDGKKIYEEFRRQAQKYNLRNGKLERYT